MMIISFLLFSIPWINSEEAKQALKEHAKSKFFKSTKVAKECDIKHISITYVLKVQRFSNKAYAKTGVS